MDSAKATGQPSSKSTRVYIPLYPEPDTSCIENYSHFKRSSLFPDDTLSTQVAKPVEKARLTATATVEKVPENKLGTAMARVLEEYYKEMKRDIGEMREDVKEIKEDVKEIKEDVKEIKEDVTDDKDKSGVFYTLDKNAAGGNK